MQVNPYLNFNGQCEAAFRFYEQCLGGKIVFMQTHGDSPMADQVPPAWRDRIIHATLKVGDTLRCRWRSRRPSGPPASACSSTDSGSRGWSTAIRRP